MRNRRIWRAAGTLRGATAALPWLVALAAVLAASPAPAALTSRGDFRILVEAVSQPATRDSSLLKLFIQIPADELAWTAHEGENHSVGKIELIWSLHAFGKVHASGREIHQERRALADDASGRSLLLVREGLLRPGEYRLELSCRDLGRKVGGFAGFFSRHPVARLEAMLSVADYGGGGVLAEPLIYTRREEDGPAILNPTGIFGERDPWLELRTTFVPPRPLPEEAKRYLALALDIRDEEGELIFESKGGWRYDAKPLPLHFRIPLDQLAAGDFELTLFPRGEGVDTAPVRVPLRVLSSLEPRPAELDRRAIEAQLFLTSASYDDWLRLPAGERVAMMRRFWRGQDPNPGTRENEVYDEFRRRYDLAQERFSGFRPGALTDRGRMLIRYGEPNEIRAEVMPENRAALINAIRDLHGKAAVEPGLSAWSPDMAEGQETTDPALSRDLARIGQGNSINFGNESEPFEVWSYQFGGNPLLPRYRLNLRGPSLKVIFADRKGYGDYELLYRSEDFDF